MTEPKPSKPSRRADNSANVALMHEVWRQAYESPEPFLVPCGTAGEANRMRTSLYNAVRNVKNYPEDYPTMVDPVNNCEIVKSVEDPTTLIIRRKELSPRMQMLRETLQARGVRIKAEALAGTPKQREMQASMDRLLQGLAAGKAEAEAVEATIVPRMTETHNPFFTREKQ